MRHLLCFALCALACDPLLADQTIDPRMHHLRAGEAREWSDFPEKPEGDRLAVKFNARPNDTEAALRIRHRDLRYDWRVQLNGKPIGKLAADDSETVRIFAVSPGTLREGENELLVAGPTVRPGASFQSDDVMIGRIDLLDRPRAQALTESTLDVSIVDPSTGRAIPARLAIVDEAGGLAETGTEPGDHLAIRPGIIYTSTGQVKVRLPAAKYTVCAIRGFEWGMDSATIDLAPGKTAARRLSIRREVDTSGYVASDTHMHTATYARHGDCTMAERMVTLAGEGIELPISTEHNLQIDFDKPAEEAHVRSYFTPVLGNELTTAKFGHFNVFPIEKSAKLIDFRAPTWKKLFASAGAIAPGFVSILNHGRDIHAGFRPLDPSHHIAMTGEVLDDWLPPIDAMEVINSGATTCDPLVLFRDWLALLNRGYRLAPIGGSDSHDVSRYIVGQARTYVRCDDSDPGNIDVKKACEAIREGRTLASFGLFIDMKVNGKAGIGDTVKADGDVEVLITVQGPSWTRLDRVALYGNGSVLRERKLQAGITTAGVKWTSSWKIPKPRHDMALVALATGPGIEGLHWPVARPYQPTSPDWKPYVFACTGAVYVDADGSGKFECAYAQAKQIVDQSAAPEAIFSQLKDRDPAVAHQAASLLKKRPDLDTPGSLVEFARPAPESVRKAFEEYAAEWKESIAAGQRAAKTSH